MVIRTRMPIPDSWRGAKCHELHITSWERDPPFDSGQQDDMIAFCSEPEPCSIRHLCLLFALMNSCTDGVWGGMSPQDRRALRRKYPLPPGRRNEKGRIEHHPHPEWKWLPPGEAKALLTAGELTALETEADCEEETGEH
jgi:hypothetical protein